MKGNTREQLKKDDTLDSFVQFYDYNDIYDFTMFSIFNFLYLTYDESTNICDWFVIVWDDHSPWLGKNQNWKESATKKLVVSSLLF